MDLQVKWEAYLLMLINGFLNGTHVSTSSPAWNGLLFVFKQKQSALLWKEEISNQIIVRIIALHEPRKLWIRNLQTIFDGLSGLFAIKTGQNGLLLGSHQNSSSKIQIQLYHMIVKMLLFLASTALTADSTTGLPLKINKSTLSTR